MNKTKQKLKEEKDKQFLIDLKRKRFIPYHCQRLSTKRVKHRHISKNTITRNRLLDNRSLFKNINFSIRKKDVKV
jgi:hypothetical protein